MAYGMDKMLFIIVTFHWNEQIHHRLWDKLKEEEENFLKFQKIKNVCFSSNYFKK